VDLKDIKKIVELMDEHELSFFHLEKEDFNLKLKKGMDADAIRAAMPMAAPVAAPVASAPAAPASAPADDAAPAMDGTPIDSPMVGTFYRKSSPDAPNYVEVGTTINEGDTICIIEAMKVMNEIKAETSGTITAILVDDSTPVQFGDTLFTVK
jgi:oxaloacetate decarboxylase alpha subunit/acetyl-CoA carboxylase biotin carboxyl carrier protein